MPCKKYRYVVTASRNGRRIKSRAYSKKSEAEKRKEMTKKYWKSFKNPRVKKVKK